MKENPTKGKEEVGSSINRVFYLERQHMSNPQLVIITASNLEEATEMFDAKLEEENCPPGHYGELAELNTSTKRLQIFSPPGDRSLIR